MLLEKSFDNLTENYTILTLAKEGAFYCIRLKMQ